MGLGREKKHVERRKKREMEKAQIRAGSRVEKDERKKKQRGIHKDVPQHFEKEEGKCLLQEEKMTTIATTVQNQRKSIQGSHTGKKTKIGSRRVAQGSPPDGSLIEDSCRGRPKGRSISAPERRDKNDKRGRSKLLGGRVNPQWSRPDLQRGERERTALSPSSAPRAESKKKKGGQGIARIWFLKLRQKLLKTPSEYRKI